MSLRQGAQSLYRNATRAKILDLSDGFDVLAYFSLGISENSSQVGRMKLIVTPVMASATPGLPL